MGRIPARHLDATESEVNYSWRGWRSRGELVADTVGDDEAAGANYYRAVASERYFFSTSVL